MPALIKKYKFPFLLFFFSLLSFQLFAQQDYATLYAYRIKKMTAGSTYLKIYLNNLEIAQVPNGGRLEYRIYKEGRANIMVGYFSEFGAPDSYDNSVSLDIKKGESYYMRGEGKRFIIVSAETGKSEFENSANFKGSVNFIDDKPFDYDAYNASMNTPVAIQKEPTQPQQPSEQKAEQETQYRGSGDPFKGLNVSKTKEMHVGKYYALIIGIDNYSGFWPPLKNAVNDAEAIKNILSQKYMFDEIKTIYNEQATRKNILNAFESDLQKVKEDDNIFIFYSGHGQYKKEVDKGYWVPVDATTNAISGFISNGDIQIFLNGIKSKHTLLVSDACFSGDIFRGSTVSVPFEDSDRYYVTVHNLVSRQAITSGGIEPVMDGGREGHSVFAYYFLKTLRSSETKYLDASQLYESIKIPVMNNSEQTPKINSIKNTGDEGGQFIFIKK